MNHSQNIKDLIKLTNSLEYLVFKNFFKEVELPCNIKNTSLKCVMTLYFKKESSMSQLSKSIMLEKGSFTAVANQLIKIGYIKKSEDTTDKRRSLLKLTKKGEELAKYIIWQHELYLLNKINNISQEDKEEFLFHIEKLSEILDRVNV
ncbi:MAG: MarR family winged helix-turn-helix transcriptional regulator [Lachnospirales bacterium]